jgi:signal transduction histidine kinase
VGIPAEDLPHVFQQRYRGRNVDRAGRGTGLGLAMVRHMVAEHGGTTRVESEQGQGSIFSLRLPLEPPKAHAPSS